MFLNITGRSYIALYFNAHFINPGCGRFVNNLFPGNRQMFNVDVRPTFMLQLIFNNTFLVQSDINEALTEAGVGDRDTLTEKQNPP